ncbi:hypothetical protein SKTS_23080 [Sulfurimicrobium lacus]|uniref:Uncharacterized protein n=1 Tax=Sulfurimicrobium lacus TaxID=2715678 RepID=A0A6F8VEP9_9PROT|nr:hypothetical protein SKTS_23080 [Sulfurimicrobium lacus]
MSNKYKSKEAKNAALLAEYLRLSKIGAQMRAEADATVCDGGPHDWVYSGQTLTGSVEVCSKCKRVRVT